MDLFVDSRNEYGPDYNVHPVRRPGSSVSRWMTIASPDSALDSHGLESERIFFHLQALRSLVDRKDLKGGIVLEGDFDLHYLLRSLSIDQLADEDFLSFSYSAVCTDIPIKHLGAIGIISQKIEKIEQKESAFLGYWISRTRAQEILFLFDRPFYSIPGKMTIDRLFRSADEEIKFTFPQLVFNRSLSKESLFKDQPDEEMDLIYRLPELDSEIATWMGYSIDQKGEREFLQTLLAFRRVINDQSDCAIILQPKARLVEGFSDKFDFLSDEIDQDLLILSPINEEGLEFFSETEDGNAIYEVNHTLTNHQLDSIGGYWISREWIERLLHLFDRPRRYLPPINDFNLLSVLTSSGAILGTIRDPLVFI
jgi:hypothetical protein